LRPRLALAFVVGAVVFCGTIAMRAQILASQDLYLHISIGRWILSHHRFPDHGIFSATRAAVPWMADEWLASTGLALLYGHFGWGGVLICVATLMAIAIGALTFAIARALGPLGASSAAVLSWGLCINHLVARPHVASLPLLVIWLAPQVKARSEERAPPLYLAPLMTLWANLHGSFIFGLGLTALLAAEAAFEAQTLKQAVARGRAWGVFLAASVIAATITPYGLGTLLFPIDMLSLRPALATVFEWQPSTVANNAPLFLWGALLLFLALLSGLRVAVFRLVIFMLLLYMALAHRRHTELLGLAAPLLLLSPIASSLSQLAPGFVTRWGVFARPAVNLACVCAGLVMAGVIGVAGSRHIVRGPDIYSPAGALAAVEACAIRGPVLNSQNFGGFLIFRGYRPFIDGRIELYGNDFMLRYMALNRLDALLKDYHIAWTIFEPNSPHAILMDHLAGWSRLFADDIAVVHVRGSAPPHCADAVAGRAAQPGIAPIGR
jgi:hypothetical protein